MLSDVEAIRPTTKQRNKMNKAAASLPVSAMSESQLSLLDEIIHRSRLIESCKTKTNRGFRVHGRFYFYFHDANHAARVIALRMLNSSTAGVGL